MLAAAALCPSPPLLARELTGQALVLPELRAACGAAVDTLLAAGPDVVAIVGPAEATGRWQHAGRFDWAGYAPALRADTRATAGGARSGRPLPLPLSLGIGALLLDEAGYMGDRVIQAIGTSAPPRDCLRLGREIAALAPRVALLAMGDGSARHSQSAPGYLDERAAPFDTAIENAVRDGDLAALAAVDPVLAAELMAAGRPAWQALAGAFASSVTAGDLAAAAGDRATGGGGPAAAGGDSATVGGGLVPRLRGEILYSDAPLGVAYLVAVLTRGADPAAGS